MKNIQRPGESAELAAGGIDVRGSCPGVARRCCYRRQAVSKLTAANPASAAAIEAVRYRRRQCPPGRTRRQEKYRNKIIERKLAGLRPGLVVDGECSTAQGDPRRVGIAIQGVIIAARRRARLKSGVSQGGIVSVRLSWCECRCTFGVLAGCSSRPAAAVMISPASGPARQPGLVDTPAAGSQEISTTIFGGLVLQSGAASRPGPCGRARGLTS